MVSEESSEPFQLHKFNVVALDKIFEHLSLVDIFHLSLTSPEIREALGEASLPIIGIKVSYKSTLPTIELISDKSSLLWTSGYPDSDLEYAGEIKIGRYSFKCMKSANGFHTDHFDIEQGFFSVLTYFTKIFKCKNTAIRELFIDLGVIEDCRTICSHYSGFKNIERLSISQSIENLDAATSFGVNFDWIMANLKPKEIYLGVEVMENVITQRRGIFDIRPTPKRFEKILGTDHICVRYSDWISDEDFLKLDVKTACLMNSVLSEQVLNIFIKKWLESESDKLYWMEVRVMGRNLDKNAILSGLDVQADTYRLKNSKCSCPYRRFETYENTPFVFPTNSRQVTRGDGSASATISILADTFFFHVKNDGPITTPDPPRPVIQNLLNQPLRGMVIEHEVVDLENEIEQLRDWMLEGVEDLGEARRRRFVHHMRLAARRRNQ